MKTRPAETAFWNGKIYYFCNPSCKARFEKERKNIRQSESAAREFAGSAAPDLRYRHMLRPANVSRHLTTRLGAAPTDFRAVPHDLIVAGKTFAMFSAALADFGTDLARARVQVGIAEHEISAGLADLRTVEQQRNMVRLCISAALLQ